MMEPVRFLNGELANLLDPLAPLPLPVLVNAMGEGFFPHAFYRGQVMLLPVCQGVATAWAPGPDAHSAVLCLFGGNPGAPTDEAIAIHLSRDGLRALIAGLQSIGQQLGEY